MTSAKKLPTVVVMGRLYGNISINESKIREVSQTNEDAARLIKNGKADGLILCGGPDVEPNLYGETPHPSSHTDNPRRDLAEYYAIEEAIEKEIPVLGICRGMQMMNVACGGTLYQHIPELTIKRHTGGDHAVLARTGSKFEKLLKGTNELVLSLHHQAADRIATGFQASAKAKDGMIEAIETTGTHWMLGVQFHPELREGRLSRNIFAELVRQMGGTPRIDRPAPKGGNKKNTSVIVHHKTGVLTTWKCFRCNIRFDDREDHLDHMFFLHGVDLLGDNALINTELYGRDLT